MEYLSVLVVLALLVSFSAEHEFYDSCEVRAQTEGGWVCGLQLEAEGVPYASFLNIQFAEQPLGELRFKELQPVKPWGGFYDATKEGPICPQYDTIYGLLMANRRMSEACIHANIFVPLHALVQNTAYRGPGLPILVYIHGGGFTAGSGEPDLHGPEYLIQQNIIVITFNKRINFLGYLSLGSSTSIPGNNGLRDAVTFLKWIKRNARFFGGNPDDITIGGQSAGAVDAHLLTLSKAANGLFNRAILMSGVGIRGFFSASPEHAKYIAENFLKYLNIKETDPEKIHQVLIKTPIEDLINATSQVQSLAAITFSPVIESESSSHTVIIDKDPEELLNEGQGKHIPLLIGFTITEGAFFIPIYYSSNILESIEKNPLLVPSPDLVYKLPEDRSLKIAEEIKYRYFKGIPSVEKYAKLYTDVAFIYPALKLAEKRGKNDSAPVYLYEFAYNPDYSAIEVTKGIHYYGAAHVEDLTFIFQTNSLKWVPGFVPRNPRDTQMRWRMTSFVKDFMTCNTPVCRCNKLSNNIDWPPENEYYPLQYQIIEEPWNIQNKYLSYELKDILQYYDKFFDEIKMCTIAGLVKKTAFS